jgi:hypothetical protein
MSLIAGSILTRKFAVIQIISGISFDNRIAILPNFLVFKSFSMLNHRNPGLLKFTADKEA